MQERDYILTDQVQKNEERGLFISIEGPDGAGKSTQLEKIREYFHRKEIPVMFLREPGGTDIGEKLREIILDPENSEMRPLTEALLYAAARAQLVEELILPNLQAGITVVCDRYIDSSIAYQAFGRRLGSVVEEINKQAVEKAMPDLTILLLLSSREGLDRIDGVARKKDRIENASLDFHQRVLAGYKNVAINNPERVFEIDASLPIEEVAGRIEKRLDQAFEEKDR